MKNLIAVCGLSLLLVAIMVGCSKPSPAEPPVKLTLEGRWSGFEAGSTQKTIIEFKDNQFTYWDANANELGGGTFVVNDGILPKQMDLTFERIPAPKYVGKVGLAIFEFQGQQLIIAGAEPGTTVRPTGFTGEQGVRTFTLKRD